MKAKKLILALSSALLVLSGCSNGNGSSSTGASGSPGRNDLTGQLGTVDLFDLDFFPSGAKSNQDTSAPQCSSDGSVCITSEVDIVGGHYYTGMGGVKAWLSPQQTVSYTVTFNNDVSNFRISNIVGDLNGESSVNGYIAQLDTSECDVASATKKDGSCRFGVIYSADSTAFSSDVLNINYTFVWDGGSLTFVQPTQNVSYSNQPLGLLNQKSGGGVYQLGSIVENSDGSDLEYSDEMNFMQSYINNGSASIVGQAGVPSVSLALAKSNRFNSSNSTIFYADSLMTTCDDGNVVPGAECAASFKYSLKVESSIDPTTGHVVDTIKTQDNFLIAHYNNGLDIVTYQQPLVISTGDFKGYQNEMSAKYSTDPIAFSVPVDRPFFGDGTGYLNYAPVDSNITFELRYDPKHYIAHAVVDNKMVYGVGRYDMGITPEQGAPNVETWEGGQIAGAIPLSWNQDCFDELSAVVGANTCSVAFAGNTQVAALLINKPIGLRLYAKYYSPVENRNVDQFIGNIGLFRDATDNSPHAPDGIYMYADKTALGKLVANDPGNDMVYSITFNDGQDPAAITSLYLNPFFFARAYNVAANNAQGIPVGYNIFNSMDEIWLGYRDILIDGADSNVINLSHFGSPSGCVIYQQGSSYSMTCPVTFQLSNTPDKVVHKITCPITAYYTSRATTDHLFGSSNFGVDWPMCDDSKQNMGYSFGYSGLYKEDVRHVSGLYINMLSQ